MVLTLKQLNLVRISVGDDDVGGGKDEDVSKANIILSKASKLSAYDDECSQWYVVC